MNINLIIMRPWRQPQAAATAAAGEGGAAAAPFDSSEASFEQICRVPIPLPDTVPGQ
jgi:hypothetical protein